MSDEVAWTSVVWQKRGRGMYDDHEHEHRGSAEYKPPASPVFDSTRSGHIAHGYQRAGPERRKQHPIPRGGGRVKVAEAVPGRSTSCEVCLERSSTPDRDRQDCEP